MAAKSTLHINIQLHSINYAKPKKKPAKDKSPNAQQKQDISFGAIIPGKHYQVRTTEYPLQS